VSTYTQLQSRIADDLNRTDLTSQIQQNILLAIQYYKGERFWFNETTTTLTATVGQAYVTAPTDILRIDALYITVSSRNVPLQQLGLDEIIAFRPSSNSRPRAYCYYQNRFELDAPADSAYSMPLYYVEELAALSAAGDTNGWTTDGEDLIVFCAEKKLYANVIKDQEKAATAAAQEREALTALRSLSRARTTTGYTKAYYL
jgi:hypothetical protein